MATNMPTGLDTFIDPTAGDTLDNVGGISNHHGLHGSANDALTQVEKMTVGPFHVNVKGYGAKGDGSTNDTTAITNAAAAVNATGGILYFPPGTYVCTLLTNPFASNVRWLGAGQGVSIIQLQNGANSRLISATSTISNVALQGLTFDCNGGNQSDGAARDDRSGVYLLDITGLRLIDCQVKNCRHGAGARIDGSANTSVRGCTFTNNGVTGAAFPCDSLFVGDSTDVTVAGSQFDTCTDSCVAIVGCSFVSVTGNTCTGFVHNGINGSSSASFAGIVYAISGNSVHGALGVSVGIDISNNGLTTTNMRNVSITGNAIENCNNSLVVEQVGQCTVSGNTCTNAAQQHVIISANASGSASDLLFDGNIFYTASPNGGVIYGSGSASNVSFTDNFFDVGNPVSGTVPSGTIMRSNRGYNPYGPLTSSTPAVPASGTAYTNNAAPNVDATVHIAGGTVTAVAVGGTATGLTTPCSVRVPVGQSIKLTYSVAPTWVWIGD